MPRQQQAPDNPCLKEHQKSMDCLAFNHYDKDSCKLYFQNYTNCMKFWTEIKNARRRQGISPELPDIKDRERIKHEFLTTGTVK